MEVVGVDPDAAHPSAPPLQSRVVTEQSIEIDPVAACWCVHEVGDQTERGDGSERCPSSAVALPRSKAITHCRLTAIPS